MIIDLKKEISNYSIIPKGVIHIGAHLAEEYSIYKEIGFKNQIWIEANPTYYEQTLEYLKDDKNCMVYNELIYDKEEEIKFNLANNGQSSSVLNFKLHKKYYPYIDYTNSILIKGKRMDTLIVENNINMQNYNVLSLDIQGVELNAIKSFGKYINSFEFIETEVNIEELYQDCCLINDIDLYLKNYGFNRTKTILWDNGNVGWGDALYIKNK